MRAFAERLQQACEIVARMDAEVFAIRDGAQHDEEAVEIFCLLGDHAGPLGLVHVLPCLLLHGAEELVIASREIHEQRAARLHEHG